MASMLPPTTVNFAASVLLLLAAVASNVDAGPHDDPPHYFNDWVVKIRGGRDHADRLASELGYRNLGQVGSFPDTYWMQKEDHPRRSRRDAPHLTRRLIDDFRVEWAEQQYAKTRVKRDEDDNRVDSPKQNEANRFNDPLWQHEWYLMDTRPPTSKNLPKLDLNVVAVWNMGYTGKNISVTVIDDGLEWNHTDLLRNYDPYASTDLNSNDDDPFPVYDFQESNRHGTRCAGEIAMIANNDYCGVGVAYDCKIGGIRLLDGPVTDMLEARALSHNLSHVQVFSASWGPTDDGRTVEGPGRLAEEAFQKGITEGRNGKGVIYVWAAGNGGTKGDNCNCDGYTGSIYTLSVGSASEHGRFPWYGEMCASTLASTYSSGAYLDQRISSTDLHDLCTVDHTGTSAAAPLAAGIVALALEANPQLTWRDMQHLVVWTSENAPLSGNDGWSENAVGLRFNARFGFGLMDAAALVTASRNWSNVPPQAVCQQPPVEGLPLDLANQKEIKLIFPENNCKDTDNEVNYLEHVEVKVDLDYSRRGAVEVFLESPSGTKTVLLFPRKQDVSSQGFHGWRFMSVHTWGENPRGVWKLTVTDRDAFGWGNKGKLNSAQITFYGTKTLPSHMQSKRSYPEYDPLPEKTSWLPWPLSGFDWNDVLSKMGRSLRHSPVSPSRWRRRRTW